LKERKGSLFICSILSKIAHVYGFQLHEYLKSCFSCWKST